MKIFVATDINIFLHEGKILANGKHSTILRRYYQAFGPIVLCARFNQIDGDPRALNDISDIVDSVVEMPSLYRMFLNKCNRKMEEAMVDCQLVVGRCPSISAYKAADIAKKKKIPFFAESMGCAWDAYWNHGLQGKLIAPYMFFKMKQVVKHADYALYVTSHFLQDRYPCKNESVAASNVLIQNVDENVQEKRLSRIEQSDHSKITLITTAAVNVRYKGQEYVIKAIPELERRGYRAEYILIGEGDNSYLTAVAEQHGVSDRVKFLGRISLEEVFRQIDNADIYIQPSLQEGLPRSVIEAMSRGCPCIGAKTAGIPELLDPRFVVKRKSVSDIVDKIILYCQLPVEERKAVAVRNFEESKLYQAEVLDDRRNKYYKKVVEEITK